MNASQYVKTDRLKTAVNRFIQSNQLNEHISQRAEFDSMPATRPDHPLFSRVYSTPHKRHEEVMNLLRNRLPGKDFVE